MAERVLEGVAATVALPAPTAATIAIPLRPVVAPRPTVDVVSAPPVAVSARARAMSAGAPLVFGVIALLAVSLLAGFLVSWAFAAVASWDGARAGFLDRSGTMRQLPLAVVVAAPAASGAMPLGASAPERLAIAAVGIDTSLMELGLETDGELEVPAGGFPAGWYTGAPTPGEAGTAVVAGHVDWQGPGVFHNLGKVKVGDEVEVTRADASVAVFGVTSVTLVPKTELRWDAILGEVAGAQLVLVTCGGDIDPGTGHYADNWVVTAMLVRSTPPLGE